MTLAQSIITDNTLFLVWAGLPLFLGACSIYRSFGPYVGRCRKREREGALRVGEKENKTPSLGCELTLEHCPSLSLSLSLSLSFLLPLFLLGLGLSFPTLSCGACVHTTDLPAMRRRAGLTG